MSEIVMRQASEDDLDVLVQMYQDTQRWLASKGSDQWAANTEEKTRSSLSRSIGGGECYVAEISGQTVGMITVDNYADPEFWVDEDSPSRALYVHRMVVDRSASGKNVGGQLLEWAESLAEASGKEWLRLDAWSTNAPLHAYYRQQGFSPVRVLKLSHRGSGALFQRSVGQGRAPT